VFDLDCYLTHDVAMKACLASEIRQLSDISDSALLQKLAIEGANGDVPAGSEVVALKANTPEFDEAAKWQRLRILRRDFSRRERGVRFYTWHHPTLRFSASVVFDKEENFRPLVHQMLYVTRSLNDDRIQTYLLLCRKSLLNRLMCRASKTSVTPRLFLVKEP